MLARQRLKIIDSADPKPENGRRLERVDWVLGALAIFDCTLALVAFFAPGLYYWFIHDTFFVDPMGLFRRAGASWAAMAVIQIVALARRRNQPYWLAVAAGARWADVFTDWTCLLFAQQLTLFAKIALFVASPANAVLGWYLLKTFLGSAAANPRAKHSGPQA